MFCIINVREAQLSGPRSIIDSWFNQMWSLSRLTIGFSKRANEVFPETFPSMNAQWFTFVLLWHSYQFSDYNDLCDNFFIWIASKCTGKDENVHFHLLWNIIWYSEVSTSLVHSFKHVFCFHLQHAEEVMCNYISMWVLTISKLSERELVRQPYSPLKLMTISCGGEIKEKPTWVVMRIQSDLIMQHSRCCRWGELSCEPHPNTHIHPHTATHAVTQAINCRSLSFASEVTTLKSSHIHLLTL